MGFFVLGLNHKECPVEIREKLHFGPRQTAEALALARSFPDISELAILSTCNRVELYGFSETDSFPEESLLQLVEKTHGIHRDSFSGTLYRHEAREAVRHLFRVSAGLDSLVVGENEILGQVRDCFRAANEAKSVHSLLYKLLEKSLKVGKEVRTETKINEGAVSIPSVAVELAEKIFGRLTGQKVMVLGTGPMSVLTLKNLRHSGAEALYVASRHAEQGEKTAGEFGARWVSMEEWEKFLVSIDILIASTSAPHTIVHFDAVKQAMEARRQRPLFLIDIAVPRNMEACINSIDNVYLYNIDDLKGVAAANLRLRRREIDAAEALVDQAVFEYQGWLEQLKARPTLERFQMFLDEILERELAPLFQEKDLSKRRKDEIRQRIRAKLLHPPLEKIKEASLNGGVTRYLEALHSLFDLDKK